MKKATKIFLTNWVNFVLISILVSIHLFVRAYLVSSITIEDKEDLWSVLLSVLFRYGTIFCIGFFILITLLDILLLCLNKQSQYSKITKIVLTNWINFASVFITVYVIVCMGIVIEESYSIKQTGSWMSAFLLVLFLAAYGVLGYGMIFWIGFFIAITSLDILFFSFNKQFKYTNYKLATEWILISSPFIIYWVIRDGSWILLVAVLAFLVGQILRKPRISKILQS